MSLFGGRLLQMVSTSRQPVSLKFLRNQFIEELGICVRLRQFCVRQMFNEVFK